MKESVGKARSRRDSATAPSSSSGRLAAAPSATGSSKSTATSPRTGTSAAEHEKAPVSGGFSLPAGSRWTVLRGCSSSCAYDRLSGRVVPDSSAAAHLFAFLLALASLLRLCLAAWNASRIGGTCGFIRTGMPLPDGSPT